MKCSVDFYGLLIEAVLLKDHLENATLVVWEKGQPLVTKVNE